MKENKEQLFYYSRNQGDLESKPAQFDFYFKEHHFIFHTDSGVFSKNYIDYGSFVMLNNFCPNSIDLPILDMGAGYGPLGIVISILYNKKTVMAEINERAYNLILKNVNENNSNSIVYNSDLYEKIDDNMKFSSVVTNPPIRAGKEVINKIYDGAFSHLEIGGDLWVVIQKKQGAPSTKDYLTNLFGNCEIIKRDKGYYILKSIKM